jgi:eukaryotic-like serine/threonine-protein kinase
MIEVSELAGGKGILHTTLPATLAGRFDLQIELGAGGMGTVYKARDTQLGCTVAIKLLHPELAGDAAAIGHLKRELMASRTVCHENTIQIFDLGEAQGWHFLSMAYIEGGNLRQLLAKHDRLPVRAAIAIAAQICAGLSAAHSKNVLHLDLKPENVLIGADRKVVLSDFELGGTLPDEEEHAALLERRGTPAYIAPEQALGGQAAAPSDVYAFGLIFYEMLTGRLPAGDFSVYPRSVGARIPAQCRRIIGRCLETEPQNRYTNACELSDDLNKVASGFRRPIGSRLLPPRGRRWPPMIPLLALLGATALVGDGFRTHIFPAASAQAARSVAVFPFSQANVPQTAGFEAEGLADGIASRLAGAPDVNIVPPDRVSMIVGQPLKTASRLGVGLILTGNLAGEGDAFKIHTELQEVGTGRISWSHDFRTNESGILGLIGTVSSQISAVLSGPHSKNRSREPRPADMAATVLYYRAKSASRHSAGASDVLAANLLFQQAIDRDPSAIPSYIGYAQTSIRLKHMTGNSSWQRKTEWALRQIQTLGLDNSESGLLRNGIEVAQLYADLRKLPDAVSELQQVTRVFPNSDEAYRLLSQYYREAGLMQEAITASRAAVGVNPHYWLNYRTLGGTLFAFGRYEEALQPFQVAQNLNPSNSSIYNNLGGVYIQLGRYDQATDAIEKGLRLSRNANGYSNLGTAFFGTGKFNLAIPFFQQALALDPGGDVYAANLASAYQQSGQSAKAIELYHTAVDLARKALTAQPDNFEVLGHLAVYYAHLGNADASYECIREARSLDPENPDLLFEESIVNALFKRNRAAIDGLAVILSRGYPMARVLSTPDLQSLLEEPDFRQLQAKYSSRR